jgi:hypothetical protein
MAGSYWINGQEYISVEVFEEAGDERDELRVRNGELIAEMIMLSKAHRELMQSWAGLARSAQEQPDVLQALSDIRDELAAHRRTILTMATKQEPGG